MRYIHRSKSELAKSDDGVNVLDLAVVRSDTHVFVYGPENVRRQGPSYELLTDDDLRHFSSPQCPGCGKTHERKRLDLSLTFDVKETCGWHGGIPLPKRPPSDALALVPKS